MALKASCRPVRGAGAGGAVASPEPPAAPPKRGVMGCARSPKVSLLRASSAVAVCGDSTSDDVGDPPATTVGSACGQHG
jgi:hypothetical protein|eukprot:COSAG01_NODE_29805_length_629_cov_0.733962_1_plen_79_part_00